MATDLKCFQIFVASPPGLGAENRAVRDEIDQYNRAEAMTRGVLFLPGGSETSFGSVGREQTAKEVRASDYFILLLWDRWGLPPDTKSPGAATSNTEEAYRAALGCLQDSDRPMRELVMMFKAVAPQQLSDPGPQLDRVLEFKQEIEQRKKYRADSFDTTQRCRTLMRQHLAAWVDEQGSGPASSPGTAEESSRPVAKAFEHLERPLESLTTRAWRLAEEGRLTESEVEFAKTLTGEEHPETLVSYALFLSSVGRLDQAKMMLESAVQMAEELDEAPAVANACCNLGIVLELGGDPDGAEKMYRKSLEAAERLGLSPEVQKMTSLLENLGSTSE